MVKIINTITGEITEIQDEISEPEISEKEELKYGYFKISKKRWFDRWKNLNVIQRSIMVSLWLYGASTCVCWVSQRQLADFLNLDKVTINRNTEKLRKMGFIKIEKVKGRGRYFNKYYLIK